MTKRSLAGGALAAVCLALCSGASAYMRTDSAVPDPHSTRFEPARPADGRPKARHYLSGPLPTQLNSSPNGARKGAVLTIGASGTFEVRLKPQASETEDATLGRMTIDKQFHGDLEGTSKGQMLTAGTDVKGSAGYVAIERVSGSLTGRSGTFMLQHTGTMTRGAPQLSVTVVPDSGTGQLAGLSGKMEIKIADGKHFYDFEYTLAGTPR